jgi:gamma-aminobutyric acid type B receptor
LNKKVIKVAQPMFCVAFCVSSAIVSVSNILFVGENNDTMCMLRPFVFNIFFDIMFGSLFLKTFRVYKIFGNKSLSKVKVSSFDVIKTYGAVLAVDVVLLIVWYIDVGMEGEVIQNTLPGYQEISGTYDTKECKSADMYEFATTFFKILLVVCGVYLSYITRNVPDKFAESKWIALSVYQVFVLGLVGLLVKGAAPGSLLLVQGITVPLACMSTTSCIFGPKVLMIKNPQNYETALQTSANTSQGSSQSDVSHSQSEIDGMLKKIEELESEVASLKGQ